MGNNTENSSVCRLIAKSDDIPEDKRELLLPHGVPVVVGRSPFTGIIDPQLSRNQAVLTADCYNENIKIKVNGPNPCGVNGFSINTDNEFVAENGSILELLLNTYCYEIKFDSASTKNLKTNSLKNKNHFAEGNVSKKIKTSGNSSLNSSALPKYKPNAEESMKMFDNGTLYVYTSKGVIPSKKIAAFDLDGTIIKPKSGNKFPKDKDDWQIIFNSVPAKLKNHIENGYKVVIFTNQKATDKKPFNSDNFKSKLQNIFSRIGIPVQAFISTSDNKYRKPVTGMWKALEEMNDGVPIEKSASFYCGDAAGRKDDHSFTDLLFAENLHLKFFTPETHFKGATEKSFSRPKFDPKTLSKNNKYKNLLRNLQEIVVMVGLQGCGKSTLTKKMIAESNGNYQSVSQDHLKSIAKCLSTAESFLKSKKSIIVDNTNLEIDIRRKWTNLAKKYKISCRCIWLDLSIEHCQHNNHFRQLTDKHHSKINNMIYNISKKKFQPPEEKEDFDEICKIQFVPEFTDKEKEKLYFQHLLG